MEDEHIIENKELSIWEAIIPIVVLVGMLAYNVYLYGDDALSGSNQFVLLMGAAVAAIVGFRNKVTYRRMIEEVAENVKSTTGALLNSVIRWLSCWNMVDQRYYPSHDLLWFTNFESFHFLTCNCHYLCHHFNCHGFVLDNFGNGRYCPDWNW